MRCSSIVPALTGAAVLFGIASTGAAPAFGATASTTSDAVTTTAYAPVAGTFAPTTDIAAGAYSSPLMSVEFVLAPSNPTLLSGLLANVYDPASPQYHNWLEKGRFNSLFAPDPTEAAALAAYLKASGLAVTPAASPFLIRATGPSSTIAAALRTGFRTYVNPSGVAYFANVSPVQLPANAAAGVAGVVGLSSTVRVRPQIATPLSSKTKAPATSCEAPYVTRAQIFAAINNGTPFPFGYGGGPGCNGLTPSQITSFYGAPSVGPRGKGAGINLALFELSAYQQSDIAHFAHTFFGSGYRAPLVDITVDGGPLSPICPAGDTCPPSINGYAGDVEVALDIETDVSFAPAASHILVYNAPNDYTGQTELDEYAAIANDDLADVVSSSWAICENDAGPGFVQAENVLFEQMALQGQSVFSASGDTGAFACIRSDGTTIVNALDPAAQPWVTSVGGTSFETDNPGHDPTPSYPAQGEAVWNVLDLCNRSADEGGHSGFFYCAALGAGGGGYSQYWRRPFYQAGPGIVNPYSAYGNGTTKCAFAPVGAPCREVPDVSAHADQYAPVVFYCTTTARTTNSECALYSSRNAPGWFGSGGTSEASPIWSAVFADRDSYLGSRSGNANALLYTLYDIDARGYFHDVLAAGHIATNDGLFPVTSGFDLATGIGTPKMSAIITGRPAP